MTWQLITMNKINGLRRGRFDDRPIPSAEWYAVELTFGAEVVLSAGFPVVKSAFTLQRSWIKAKGRLSRSQAPN